jgi:hypothetical protein
MSNSANDEFDMIAMILDIWRSKFQVLAIIVTSLFFSLTYLFFASEEYLVSSEAAINIYNPVLTQNCTTKRESGVCIDRLSFLALGQAIGSNWQVSEKGTVSMVTQSPNAEAFYVSELSDAIQRSNQDLLKDAQEELQFLQNLDNAQVAATEVFVSRQLSALHAIYKLDSGENSFTISPPTIKKIAPKGNLVIFGFLIAGIFLSIVFVAARSALVRRR